MHPLRLLAEQMIEAGKPRSPSRINDGKPRSSSLFQLDLFDDFLQQLQHDALDMIGKGNPTYDRAALQTIAATVLGLQICRDHRAVLTPAPDTAEGVDDEQH